MGRLLGDALKYGRAHVCVSWESSCIGAGSRERGRSAEGRWEQEGGERLIYCRQDGG